eukprot:scaffold148703_cov19-Tisochrysis_lutea.AAC.2
MGGGGGGPLTRKTTRAHISTKLMARRIQKWLLSSRNVSGAVLSNKVKDSAKPVAPHGNSAAIRSCKRACHVSR